MTQKEKVPLPAETLEAFGGDEIRARVFYEKYAMKDESGIPTETTPQQMWRRIAHEMASVEKTDAKRKKWEERFYWLLSDFRFVAGGRIMFGAGQPRKATLLNCYVIKPPEDTLTSIWDCSKEMALTYSRGGGCGTDLSGLRPKGSPVNNSAIESTGAVSFMELYSITTGIIGQNHRRGALMLTLDVTHPDIEDFIEIKHNNVDKVRYANISIKLTDEFMKAVEENRDFTLKYKSDKIDFTRTVNAKQLWQKVIQSAHDSAEPNCLFWDTIVNDSPTEYNEMNVVSTNPCGEQPLEAYGACCLGSVNLNEFVKDEFTEGSHVNWIDLDSALRISVRFLDNVLDYNKNLHALPEQSEASMKTRRIGVGFTGLGDMLIKLGIKYDSNEAIEFIDNTFERIRNIVYDESCNLAVEKGKALGFNVTQHLKTGFVKRLPADLRMRIRKQGLRNLCILTVPPVGSGSILCGTTSGIEPIFALYYERRSESLSADQFLVVHPLVMKYLQYVGVSPEQAITLEPKAIRKMLPATFVTAHEIESAFRVKMQGTIQKYVDSSISSTINLPEDISVKAVGEIYFEAWKAGLKGVTVYREGSREGILKTVKDKDDTVPMNPEIATQTVALANGGSTLICPSCGSHDFHKENGCESCPACGYGKCSI